MGQESDYSEKDNIEALVCFLEVQQTIEWCHQVDFEKEIIGVVIIRQIQNKFGEEKRKGVSWPFEMGVTSKRIFQIPRDQQTTQRRTHELHLTERHW